MKVNPGSSCVVTGPGVRALGRDANHGEALQLEGPFFVVLKVCGHGSGYDIGCPERWVRGPGLMHETNPTAGHFLRGHGDQVFDVASVIGATSGLGDDLSHFSEVEFSGEPMHAQAPPPFEAFGARFESHNNDVFEVCLLDGTKGRVSQLGTL